MHEGLDETLDQDPGPVPDPDQDPDIEMLLFRKIGCQTVRSLCTFDICFIIYNANACWTIKSIFGTCSTCL